MLAFILHKKFWLPILIVFLLLFLTEYALRTGHYDSLVKPKSRLGQSLGRVSDLKKIHMNDIQWITVGDSKFDWGLDHKMIRLSQLKNGKKHIRMSLAGSNFMTIQSSIEWAIDNLPELEGVLLGVYESEFVTLSNPKKENKTSWPFRKYLKKDKFNYFRDFKNDSALTSVLNSLALSVFVDDIKDLLKDPIGRYQEIEKRNLNWKDHIDFRHGANKNLCDFKMKNLEQCVQSAKQYKTLESVPTRFVTPYRNCIKETSSKRLKNKQWKTPPINLLDFQLKWEYLIGLILEKNLQLKLVLLPESEYYDYMSRPSNTNELVTHILNKYKSKNNFKIIDLRNIFGLDNQCEYFFDNLHFNNKGIDEVTNYVIKSL